MLRSNSYQWNVAIFVEENESLGKTYRMSPDTSLAEMMQVWKDEFKLSGLWLFMSANEDKTYTEDWMTLEMIGLSIPKSRVLTLIAKLFDEPPQRPDKDIYFFLNEKCHHLRVKPHEKSKEVLRHLPVRPKSFIHNGVHLNMNHALELAQLKHNSCIYDSVHHVTVIISSGQSKVIQMPSNSVVYQLMDKVKMHEMGAFSLKYRGRHLDLQESVAELKHSVKVSRAKFDVHINGRTVSWTTGSRPIRFPEFVSQLQLEGNIDQENLKTMVFKCSGCGRCISQSEDDIQILPIDCCKMKSLKLKALSSSESRTATMSKDVSEHIKIFYEYMLRGKSKDSRSEVSRRLCRTMKAKSEEEDLNYMLIAECGQQIQKSVRDLEDKINTLETNIATLEAKHYKLNEMYHKLKTENDALCTENDALKKEVGVKLMLLYWPGDFTYLSRPDVQQGKYPWTIPYIKCRIAGFVPGWTSFDAVRDAVSHFFTPLRGEIRMISQQRGEVAGTEVTAVTSQEDEVEENEDLMVFCTAVGEEYARKEVDELHGQGVRSGDHVLICGGQRRTILYIHNWS